MGIYDRDYYRPERPGFSLSMPRSAVVALILINVAVYLADALFVSQNQIDNLLSARVGALTRPWLWWQFLTYGFVHNPTDPKHIVLNMLALWFLGRDVEQRYGTKEFVRIYLLLLVVGSVAWAVIGKLSGLPDTVTLDPGIGIGLGLPKPEPRLMGASGAIAGIVVLFALNFPRRIILFMFFLPMPAWVLGVIIVGFDLLGAIQQHDNVAYTVHLTGAALAGLYFWQRWNFGSLLEGRIPWPRVRHRPRLRVHRPDEEDEDQDVAEEEVDRILEKIYREGEGSLTSKERRILETASRAYQRRRKMDV